MAEAHHNTKSHFMNGSDFEYLRKQKRRYYEVVYRDYRQQHPWGTTPEDEWRDSVCNYPEGLRGKDGYTQIPINALCHVTHNREAALIRSSVEKQGCYTFKPAAKLGKQYGDDRLPLGETYRHIERRIFSEVPHSRDDPVFPGYYSWWGVSTEEHGGYLSLVTQQQQGPEIRMAEFAVYPPKSRYGNNVFTIGFSELLQSYGSSRTDFLDQEGQHIYLRVGGTLRYKYEICYIVIVCLQQDHNLNDLATIDTKDIIDHKGLLKRGRIVNYQQTPHFQAKYIVSNMSNGGQYHSFSWEQVVFALYYPSEELKLYCNKAKVTEKLIEHQFCISRQGGRCPNQL